MGEDLLKSEAVGAVKRAVAAQRPVYVCGAGQPARGLVKSLRRHGVIVTAFIDRAPHALGATLDGLPIEPVTSLSLDDPRRPFVTIVSSAAADIDADLASAGWVRDQDYVIV
jgi:hypothetical protein